jgi:17beta-estradiol 17-dehydrogenase / very-long-chain 3-oxoacyl-CoA reductase
MSVYIISRTESKLKDVQDEILKKGYKNVEVKYSVCDYSKLDTIAKAKLANELDGLDIGVLINNVGMSYRYPVLFHELTDDEVSQLIMMNIDSTIWMTRIILPGMIQRKRGTIVNISSISGTITLPLLALYGGVKSCIEKFSRSLNAEYNNKGITVQVQLPFYVATKLAKMRKSLSVPTPDEYVATAIKWIGYPDSVVSPFWIHSVQGWFMKIAPDTFVAYIANTMHHTLRKRGQKKDATVQQQQQQQQQQQSTKKD